MGELWVGFAAQDMTSASQAALEGDYSYLAPQFDALICLETDKRAAPSQCRGQTILARSRDHGACV
jgi:hypothetical protein